MTIEALYEDSDYIEYLLTLSRKNLLQFDDYRQEVFLYIAEHNSSDPRKVAKRIAMRIRRKQIKESHISIEDFGDSVSDNDYLSVLWEDRHAIA